MRDAIPTIPVPLRIHEPEPAVNLQQVLDEVYDRARYDLVIDYSQPVKPDLAREEAAWINQLLREKGLGSPPRWGIRLRRDGLEDIRGRFKSPL